MIVNFIKSWCNFFRDKRHAELTHFGTSGWMMWSETNMTLLLFFSSFPYLLPPILLHLIHTFNNLTTTYFAYSSFKLLLCILFFLFKSSFLYLLHLIHIFNNLTTTSFASSSFKFCCYTYFFSSFLYVLPPIFLHILHTFNNLTTTIFASSSFKFCCYANFIVDIRY
jgi:hypothetical protein